jgi:hypothetical protein
MHRIKTVLVMAALLSPSAVFARDAKKTPPPAKTTKAPPPAKKKPPVIVTAEHKKALSELFAGFKFGMTKDDVIGVLAKQIDAQLEDKIKATTDIAAQDRFRKDKKSEVAKISQSYTAFEGKKTGWDVSIIDGEFAHNTNESMLENWENKDGKNQRRFFFFYDGKLWKMFVQLDVSILPAEKRTFDTLQAYMTAKYGPGDLDTTMNKLSWHTDAFDVRAVDRLRDYDAIAISIEDGKVAREVASVREQHAPPKQETASVIKSVVDTDHKDHPDVKSNNDAVDQVIKAQGGGSPPPKK